jgi:hypothetical protein
VIQPKQTKKQAKTLRFGLLFFFLYPFFRKNLIKAAAAAYPIIIKIVKNQKN